MNFSILIIIMKDYFLITSFYFQNNHDYISLKCRNINTKDSIILKLKVDIYFDVIIKIKMIK